MIEWVLYGVSLYVTVVVGAIPGILVADKFALTGLEKLCTPRKRPIREAVVLGIMWPVLVVDVVALVVTFLTMLILPPVFPCTREHEDADE